MRLSPAIHKYSWSIKPLFWFIGSIYCALIFWQAWQMISQVTNFKPDPIEISKLSRSTELDDKKVQELTEWLSNKQNRASYLSPKNLFR